MKLIIITGMPGAGKSVIANAAHSLNIPVIVMGDVIRSITRSKGLEPNPDNTRNTMLKLREDDGPGAVALHCITDIKESDSETIVVEGCRSLDEVEVFRSYSDDLKIVCVHASPKTRFNRLQKRKREDAPPNWSSFRERDLREISVGLGGVIAMSDIMIINEGTLDDFRNDCINIIEELI